MKPELQYVASLPTGRPFRVRIEYHPDALLDCLDRAAGRMEIPMDADLLIKWRDVIEDSLKDNDETTFVLKVALADIFMQGFKALTEEEGEMAQETIGTIMREYVALCVGIQKEIDRRTGRGD